MDQWLLDHLVRTGVLAPGGIGRRAHVRPCPSCRRWTFQGLDNDAVAAVAVVDIAPLNAFGELVALTAGLLTYNLAWRADRYEIDHRDLFKIKAQPPVETAGFDVVSQHKCGVDIAHNQKTNIRNFRKPISIVSEHPPF